MQFTKIHQELAKPVYEAIPKIAEEAGKKWEWDPEWGERVVHNHKARIVIGINPNWITLATGNEEQAGVLKSSCIPLLHWEDHLELILEGLGWVLWNMERTVPSSDGTGSLVVVELAKGESLKRGRGKDRQEAFQRAVLAVAEELEARKEP